MVNVEVVDLKSKKEINDFVMFPFALYKGVSQWVPPFINDMKIMLRPKKTSIL